jgi:hypothetical protein
LVGAADIGTWQTTVIVRVESSNNFWRTDIAGVDDMRHACEALLNLWAQEPVSVRDDSNSEHCTSVPWMPDLTVRDFGPITVGNHHICGHIRLTLPQREAAD